METVLKWFGPFLLERLTPGIKGLLEDGIKKWHQAAKETPNPWDNLAVAFLAALLGIELKG